MWWVGTDEAGGLPNPGRPDVLPPPNWRLDMVAATERPRQCEVSPDGSTIAFMLDRDSSDVWTIPVDGGAPTRLTTHRPPAPFWEDANAVWSPDGTRLAYTHDGAVWVVPAGGGVPRRVVEAGGPVWLDDQRLVVGVDRDEHTVLAVVDAADAWPHPIARAGADGVAVVVSPDRTRVAYTVFHRDDLDCTSLHVVEVASGRTSTVHHLPGIHDRHPAWSPDGIRLAFTCEAPGWSEVFVADVVDGGIAAAAARQLTDDGADFADLSWSPDGSTLVATRARHGVTDLVTVDTRTGAVTELAHGGTWGSPRWLPDGRVVATHESFAVAPRLCVVEGGAVRVLLAPTPAAVAATAHVVAQHVSYRSIDAREVHGWLYRPARASAEHRCPVVVQPHGGPTSVTGDEWDGVAQYFVDKGYGWFAINFRGSTTYGREYERANHGVWGVDDTGDCLAAHTFLAGLDWVDPTRIAIFGASYGSYLALASVVDDPEHRYACAAAKYGDCDILTSWAQGDLIGRLDLERMMGHPRGARAAYRAGSPVHRIEQLRVPILVAHGELDRRVSPEQSRELVAELRRFAKQYEYVTYPTEGHGLLRTEPFLHFHQRLERFLDWHLMP
jgi:dipeptidyl aminopeptidase/acylaminoacyl peptidase